uniref:rRNA N-glycosidase n=1 Tax=Oryza glumipatula TaxID=40148 RepID=A0A0E0BFR1_9ORYZ
MAPKFGKRGNTYVGRPPIIEVVTYNVSTTQQYSGFIYDLRHRLAKHQHIGRPVLAMGSHPKQPARWMYINLVGNDNDRATLAVRDDNLYIIGFKNQKGQWFEIGVPTKNMPLLNSSTFLGCDVRYRSLLNVPEGPSTPSEVVLRELMSVDLRRTRVFDAVHELSDYAHPQNGVVDVATKRHLARLAVVICESARMTPHYDTVNNGYESNAPVTLTELQVNYLWNWTCMSRILGGWPPPTLPWELTAETKIKCFCDALTIVQLLRNTPKWHVQHRITHQRKEPPCLRRPPPSDYGPRPHAQLPPPLAKRAPQALSEEEKRPSSTDDREESSMDGCIGRLLVEVLTVNPMYASDNFHRCTIAIYDGERGQILFKHQEGDPSVIRDFQGNLFLTGPRSAISAEGSFLIEVNPHTPTGGQSYISKSQAVGGTLFWDCYDDDNEYDKILTDNFSTGLGPLRVTYAVLSNAVEATVQVKLLPLAGGRATSGSVFGVITVRSQKFGVGSVLFSRSPQAKVQLASDSTVPLARSVVAVPLDFPVLIEAQLHAGNEYFQGKLEFAAVVCGKQQTKQILHALTPRAAGAGNTVLEITWSPDFPR